MKLKRPVARRPAETIVALIDVVFFLLVFSLLVGRMDATAPFEVSPPLARAGADLPAGGLTVTIASEGALALNGEILAQDVLLARVEALLDDDPDQRVRFNADADTESRHLMQLIDQLSEIGAGEIVLIVTPQGPA